MTQFGVLPLTSSPAGQRIRAAGERFQARKDDEDKRRLEELKAEYKALLRRLSALAEKERRRKIARYRYRARRPATPKRITLQEIAHEVMKKRSLTWIDLRSRRKSKNLVRGRFEIMWRARKETIKSLPQIGRFFRDSDRPDGMDHTSVLHGVRRYQALVDSGEES